MFANAEILRSKSFIDDLKGDSVVIIKNLCSSLCLILQAYMDFELPHEYSALWKYLAEAYKTEAFRSTMPSDQDIVFHYEKKVTGPLQKVKHNPRPTLQSFTYTLDIPESLAAVLSSGGNTNGLSDELSRVDLSQQQE